MSDAPGCVRPPAAPAAARSLLFVPADRPERFAKAAASGADGIVLDLEDAVAPQSKAAARAHAAAWLRAGGAAVVRVNACDTQWYEDDLAMLRCAPAVPLMLPKADAAALARTALQLPGRELVALLETVAGHFELQRVAAAPGVVRIAFGSVDFALDSGIADEGEALTAVRTGLVLACRAVGLPPPLDGVSLELQDEQRMREDALRSRSLGFGGKLCIHPRQVAAVHQAFTPGEQELQWAQRVVAAFEAGGGAAIALDGRMLDKPVVDRARRLLALAGR